MKILLARKLGMTTIYKKDKADNVTLLDVKKNVIVGTRTLEKDGYSAVRIGLASASGKNNKKNKKQYEQIREFRIEDIGNFKKGEEISLDSFEKGEKVKISGVSKGKGFQGVVKRHGFAGSPASHGHRHDLRAPGSIGSAFPERVMKGKRMAGRMGGEKVTVKNMVISHVDPEKRIIALKGAVPGNNGLLVMMKTID
ncbi:MAG: 50S ribosomal protein L3 [Patescibacteria group bacterium]|nr:50S ribosomal protein L3 [Patescibacteria group bacterium]